MRFFDATLSLDFLLFSGTPFVLVLDLFPPFYFLAFFYRLPNFRCCLSYVLDYPCYIPHRLEALIFGICRVLVSLWISVVFADPLLHDPRSPPPIVRFLAYLFSSIVRIRVPFPYYFLYRHSCEPYIVAFLLSLQIVPIGIRVSPLRSGAFWSRSFLALFSNAVRHFIFLLSVHAAPSRVLVIITGRSFRADLLLAFSFSSFWPEPFSARRRMDRGIPRLSYLLPFSHFYILVFDRASWEGRF